jgi:hypothetical protein
MPSEEQKYVLSFKDKWFFEGQNLYLGQADLTKSLDRAVIMTSEEAIHKYKLMDEKEHWKVYKVRRGWVLGEEEKTTGLLAYIDELEAKLVDAWKQLKILREKE